MSGADILAAGVLTPMDGEPSDCLRLPGRSQIQKEEQSYWV